MAQNSVLAAVAGLAVSAALAGQAAADDDTRTALIAATGPSLTDCVLTQQTCQDNFDASIGQLVFPDMPDTLNIGGPGRDGILFGENGEILGYYEFAESAAARAPVGGSLVYVFRDERTLARLTGRDRWSPGGGQVAGMGADDTFETSGDPVIYILDAQDGDSPAWMAVMLLIIEPVE